MMQQTLVASWQPVRLPALAASVRWCALAVASIAVPVAMLGATFGQATAPAHAPVAPVAIEQPMVAPVSEPALPVNVASAAATEAVPSYYSYSWADECETECPARVAY